MNIGIIRYVEQVLFDDKLQIESDKFIKEMNLSASEEFPICFDLDYKNKSFKIKDFQGDLIEVEFSYQVKNNILRYLQIELEHFESGYSIQNSIEQKIVFIHELLNLAGKLKSQLHDFKLINTYFEVEITALIAALDNLIKPFEKRLDLIAPITKSILPSSPKPYFTDMGISKVKRLGVLLADNGFIREDQKIKFECAFTPTIQEDLPLSLISWIDMAKGKKTNKHSLFYLIEKLHENKFINNSLFDEKVPKIIVEHFCDLQNNPFKLSAIRSARAEYKKSTTFESKFKQKIDIIIGKITK